MGFFDFVKDAGEKIFQRDKVEAREEAAKGQSIANQIKGLGFNVANLEVNFDDGVAMLKGVTASNADRERLILVAGNTHGVARVDDQLVVEIPKPEPVFYTVQSGDTLGKIAQTHYGNAGKYPVIFEANKPMLSHPDKIYPGQVLRIPSEQD